MCHLSYLLRGTQHAQADEKDGIFGHRRFGGYGLYDLVFIVRGQILHYHLHSYMRLYRSFCISLEIG